MNKQQIRTVLAQMQSDNESRQAALTDTVSLSSYASLVCQNIWTDALQQALYEHETVVIPPRNVPYLMNRTVVIPSNRRIIAEGAVIRMTESMNTILFRNKHTEDGTHHPVSAENRDENISIIGGRWEESRNKRLGYRKSGRYDGSDSFFGVSAMMYFDKVDKLTVRNAEFFHCAGFAVQCGDCTDIHFEDIAFDSCFADGLHINGNCERVLVRHIRGEVGDDLVALNMYDWQNSSVNFGPTRCILCEDLDLSPKSPCKAMRILPGTYWYDNGDSVDCALTDAVISGVRGIKTFKLYYQTPVYRIGDSPERGAVGSADNLYFENIDIDLDGPVDRLGGYVTGDPICGAFAGFELGSNIGLLSLENIRLRLYRDRYPMGFLVTCGPKSARSGDLEIFDPYLSSTVRRLELSDIFVNGEKLSDPSGCIHTSAFDDINHDGNSTARGIIGEIAISG